MLEKDRLSDLEFLVKYCEIDDYQSLKYHLKSFGNINIKLNEKGWTLLSVAAYNHSFECVKILLENGADINSTNHAGTTILMYAKTKVYTNRNLNFLSYLIENGANPYLKDKFGNDIFFYVGRLNDPILIDFFKQIKFGK
jgi:ankyrin repeat protein